MKNTKLGIDLNIHQGKDTKLIASFVLWSITEVGLIDNVILIISCKSHQNKYCDLSSN